MTRPDIDAIRAELEGLERARKRLEVAEIDEPMSMEHRIAEDCYYGDKVTIGRKSIEEWTPALLAYIDDLERRLAGSPPKP